MEKYSKKLDLFFCLAIILAIYLHTLNHPWIFYDENIIYEERAVPIPSSFNEIFEIIGSFGIVNNFGSSNYLYSSISQNRSNLLGVPFLLFLGFLFKKNAYLYHCLNLFLHMLNTCLVYLILKTSQKKDLTLFSRAIIILLTSIWAIHPAHVEAILLSTNSAATFSYFLFFLLFYDFLINREKDSITRKIVLPFCFLFSTLLHEYVVILPMILFTYSFAENYKSIHFKAAVKVAFEQTKPYILGLAGYLIYFIFSNFSTFRIGYQSLSSFLILFSERIFWLSPQVFIHFLKLIFFPQVLSLDQTGLIYFGKSLLDLYPILCFIFLFVWLFLSLVLLILKKKAQTFFLLTWLFFISLLPFSQILSPTYCLAAERYLYCPVFFIVFCGARFLFSIFSKDSGRNILWYASTLIFLTALLSILSARSFVRTLDWKDSYSLIKSTIKSAPDYLYKGSRFNTLGETILSLEPDNVHKAEIYFKVAQVYFKKSMKEIKSERSKHKSQPIILKYYGLDYDSLLIKNAYLISIEAFTIHEKDYRKSLETLTPYLKFIDRFDPRTLELYANLLIKNNELNNAKKIFLLAYNKSRKTPYILLSLTRFESDFEKDLNNSLKYLTEALKLFPYSKEILHEALNYYQLTNNLPLYAKYTYLYGLRTHSKFAYHEALTAYLTLNELNQAKKIIDKLLRQDQSDPKTLYLSSSYYIKKKDYKQAVTLLSKALSNVQGIQTDKQLPFDINNTIASLYFALGDTEKGIYYANEALKLAKDNPNNLSKIKMLIKKFELNNSSTDNSN